ncbi:molybdopterin-dependent oxidoreductase [Caminibacter mediatlanticus]|uniref:Molybdopterin oxidoreductase n=1 Tax=Caminibacter mediatlanticus TB-2 TaxID=391592 RepID=A0AAI9F1W7_9BACT|nr:molybdopterin-dependent oxidoreductase [Caminibacter mediatlanticus]EDM24137.1 Molybdopterin oxidoreductase [Caminibacter mediatlanticus TB-2]
MFCPLDCYDACQVRIEDNKIKGYGITPYLCYKLNNYFKYKKESLPKFNGKNIMLSYVLNRLIDILKKTEPKKVLFIKGSGHMGIMQNITKLFFEKYGATFGVGSTCDGIGEIGINYTRGKSLILPTWIIKNAKKVLIWGRNPYVTNIHLLPLIKNKKIFTIDAIESKTAKNSDYFLQVKPNSDFYLAILLSQMVIERNLIKRKDGVGFNKFKEIVFSYSKEELLKKIGVSFEEVENLLEFIKDGAVVLTGLGVAKCKECYKTTAAIDSLFFLLDFFGKKDSGVAFLGSSNYGIYNPINISHKNEIALFDINLDDFDVIFIQGANPLVSFVNRNEWEKLKEKTTIVFGKYYDESAKIAKLFIPTKDFYEKKDIRGSYFDEYIRIMNNEKWKMNNKECISEYELTKFLFDAFSFDGLKEEEWYINEILNKSELEKVNETLYRKKVFNKPPYSDGFLTNDKKFHFLSKDFNYQQKPFEIVTAKYLKALNSQFERDEFLYINPKSNNIMLSFVEKNFDKNLIKYDKKLPLNIIYSKGGVTINQVLNSKGENAYYEFD